MSRLPYFRRYYLTHPRRLYCDAISRPIRKFVQRGRRGWSDEDVWSFDSYLAEVIAGGVEHLRKTDHGHPMGLDEHKWSEDGGILDRMATGFRRYYEDQWDYNDPAVRDAAHEEGKKSLKLLAKYFSDLWD